MSLYLVVRHRLAKPQSFKNVWQNESDALLMSIETTPEVGKFCSEAQKRKQRVYVHRCGCPSLGIRPMICCSVRVAKVIIDDGQTNVQFEDQRVINSRPAVRPVRRQNNYFAPPP